MYVYLINVMYVDYINPIMHMYVYKSIYLVCASICWAKSTSSLHLGRELLLGQIPRGCSNLLVCCQLMSWEKQGAERWTFVRSNNSAL